MPAPEGGENLRRSAGGADHFPGFAQKGAVEALRPDARLGERGLDPLVYRYLAAAVSAGPENVRRAARAGEIDDEGRIPPEHVEPAAGRADRLGERGERMGEPPAAGAAERAGAVGRGIADIDVQCRPFRRRPDRRLIVEPQIIA
jgi:hypothetical protein